MKKSKKDGSTGLRKLDKGYVLITGGAGFIGTNLAKRLLASGKEVFIFDNLSRPGVERNLQWLLETFGKGKVRAEISDVRDRQSFGEVLAGAEQVYHFAAQVAVTTSLEDPNLDFHINLQGTFNLLEELRLLRNPPPLVYTSTNKVYGKLEDLPLRRREDHYEPVDRAVRAQGIAEDRSLDFCSPYGCSKGAADQYVIDYSKSFGLKTVVFRMSCIYGPHQLGTEDQGWVAHFLIRMLREEPITIYGDGLQVRDVLFVEDLVDAMLLAQERMPSLAGKAFNIGGGPEHATSLKQLLKRMERLNGASPRVIYSDWRAGDQKYFVSNIGKFNRLTGWSPRIGIQEGLERLHHWLVFKGPVAAQSGEPVAARGRQAMAPQVEGR
jgi:CDP-paratose 2-epimerase